MSPSKQQSQQQAPSPPTLTVLSSMSFSSSSEYIRHLITKAEIKFVMKKDPSNSFSYYLKAAEDIIQSVGVVVHNRIYEHHSLNILNIYIYI